MFSLKVVAEETSPTAQSRFISQMGLETAENPGWACFRVLPRDGLKIHCNLGAFNLPILNAYCEVQNYLLLAIAFLCWLWKPQL